VKPISLICEGTRIHKNEKEESEKIVYNESKKIVSNSNRLVFADFNFKDIDRMRTFYNIAKENDRKFVVKLNDAYFLKYLSQDPKLNVPKFDDEDIVIYLPKRKSGKYNESDYSFKETQFFSNNTWTEKEIAQKENKVLCAMGFYNFTSLIDIKPEPGAIYIHSSSEAYNEEQEISEDRTENWLNHFGMNKFQCHCSGHAQGKELLEAVSEIDAKMLFPVHTEHPDAYKKIAKSMTLVEEGIKYDL